MSQSAKRWALPTLASAVVAVAIIGAMLHQPQPATAAIPGVPSPCDLLPDGTLSTVCDAATDPVGSVIGAIPGIPNPTDVVGGVVSAGAEAIIEPILKGIAKAEAAAVLEVLDHEVTYINESTTPALTSDWFKQQYAMVFGMAILLGIGMFVVRMTGAAKDEDPVEAGNAIISLVVLVVAGAFIPLIIGGAVRLVDDQLAPGWMEMAGQEAQTILTRMKVDFDNDLGTTAAILLPLLFLFFGVVGGILVELMFFFREGMLYIMTAAEVLALAIWAGGNRVNGGSVLQRCTMINIGLILFKLLLGFFLVIGLKLFGSHEGGSPVILGTFVLVFVPLITWAAYKQISGHRIQVSSSIMKTRSLMKALSR